MSVKITISIADNNFSEAMRLCLDSTAQIHELLDLPGVEINLEAHGVDVNWNTKALNALRHRYIQSECQ